MNIDVLIAEVFSSILFCKFAAKTVMIQLARVKLKHGKLPTATLLRLSYWKHCAILKHVQGKQRRLQHKHVRRRSTL